jgi:hypothetical protein
MTDDDLDSGGFWIPEKVSGTVSESEERPLIAFFPAWRQTGEEAIAADEAIWDEDFTQAIRKRRASWSQRSGD